MLIIVIGLILMTCISVGFVWYGEHTKNPAWLIMTIITFVITLVVAGSAFDREQELGIYRDLGKQGWSVQAVTFNKSDSSARIVTDNGWLDCELDRSDDRWVIRDIDDCNKVKPVKRDKIATPEDFNS